MSQLPPPVLGFNNNVRHRGRVFHIQTEDSGVKNPRVVTHLFADGGRIIKTIRTPYTELVGRADLTQQVRQLMKEQHKSMFSALRAGELDALLEASCGPLPLQGDAGDGALEAPKSISGAMSLEHLRPLAAPSERGLSNPALRRIPTSVPAPSREAIEIAVAPLDALGEDSPLTSFLRGPVKSEPDRARSSAPSRPNSTPAALHPVGQLGAVPAKPAPSIFGENVISEKSLDEVILSYLAEDLEGPSE